jgi:hypothetical protein
MQFKLTGINQGFILNAFGENPIKFLQIGKLFLNTYGLAKSKHRNKKD